MESLTISTPGFHPGMRCKNDFTSPIRWDPFQCNTRLSLTLLKGRIRALHACMGTQGWEDRGVGGLMCIFMPPFFPHLFVSAYQTDRHTVTG